MTHDPQSISSRVNIQSRYSTIYLPEWIQSHLDIKKQARVLDLGCAEGEFANRVLENSPEIKYTGIDQSREAVVSAQARSFNLLSESPQFLHSDFDDPLPFQSGVFDNITSFFSIYYASSLYQICKELLRILSQNGQIVFVGPGPGNKKNLYNIIESIIPEFNPMSLPAEGFYNDLLTTLSKFELDVRTQTVNYEIAYPCKDIFRAYLESTMRPNRHGWNILRSKSHQAVLDKVVDTAFEQTSNNYAIERSTMLLEVRDNISEV